MTTGRVVVVGGGLTGLVAARHLDAECDVVVLDASSRLGGAIDTVAFDGVAFDVGADAFLARQPGMSELVAALGIDETELVAPATSRVLLRRGRRLRPLPEATVFGVPTDLVALARSGALGTRGLLRAAIEPIVSRRQIADDIDVATLLTERFGRAVVDQLVEPLLGGVYAGGAANLSARATMPTVWQAAAERRSLLRALASSRRRSAAVDHDVPVFRTVRGGLSRVVDALTGSLRGQVRTSTRVVGVERSPDSSGWIVVCDAGERIPADDVVLATPTAVAAELLAPLVAGASRALAAMPTVSIAVVALAYERAAGQPPHASGVLVPPGQSDQGLVKAVTFSSTKWPHHVGHDATLIRASVGRVGDRRHDELDDDELLRRVDGEVATIAGLTGEARAGLVRRWGDVLPQYQVGHLERIEAVHGAVADAAPGLHVAGAAFGGVGLAARCRDGRHIAEQIIASRAGAAG